MPVRNAMDVKGRFVRVSRRLPSLRKYNCIETQRMRRIGVRFFNDDPFAGLTYLHSNGIMKKDPAAVAKWLLNQEGLCRSAIGEFLGSPSAFTLDVLEHYVSIQSLYQFLFVEAMRRFMSNFRIPGEAQKIERILEVFARHFTTRYPSDEDGKDVEDEHGEPRTTVMPSNVDTAHILSYSIIMLNTDLHNANVKHHMSKEEFVRNNRGIDNGKDLPPDMLENIFAEVNSQQFKAKADNLDSLKDLEKKFRNLQLEKGLACPHRQFVMKIPALLVTGWSKSQPSHAHHRMLYLFNDILIVAKKATLSSEMAFKQVILLKDVHFESFQNDIYPLGIQIHARFTCEVEHRFQCDNWQNQRMFLRQAQEMTSEAIVIERMAPIDKSVLNDAAVVTPTDGTGAGRTLSGSSPHSHSTSDLNVDAELLFCSKEEPEAPGAMSRSLDTGAASFLKGGGWQSTNEDHSEARGEKGLLTSTSCGLQLSTSDHRNCKAGGNPVSLPRDTRLARCRRRPAFRSRIPARNGDDNLERDIGDDFDGTACRMRTMSLEASLDTTRVSA